MDKKMPCSITDGEQYDDFHLPEETERQRELRLRLEEITRCQDLEYFRELWEKALEAKR